MVEVTLWLGAPDAALEVRGEILGEHGVGPTLTDVALSAVRAWQGVLDPGRHRFVFDLVAGAGPFSIWAVEGGTWRQLADFVGSRTPVRRVYEFTVLGPEVQALVQGYAGRRRWPRPLTLLPGGLDQPDEVVEAWPPYAGGARPAAQGEVPHRVWARGAWVHGAHGGSWRNDP